MTGALDHRRSFSEIIMGLPISIHRRGRPIADDAFAAYVFDDLRSADAIFSPYRDDSVLSRRIRGEIAEPDLPVPFTTVLALATFFRDLTDGAFDVTCSGQLDPSGLVKGWATQAASRWLPPDSYLNAGGDMVIKSPETPWRIGIEHPFDPAGLLAVLSVRNAAVATSGTSHRGAHILDPTTGQSATGLRQATVIGPTLTEADVWATALIARGVAIFDRSDPLLARLVERGFAALVVSDTGQVTSTAQFATYCATDFPLVESVGPANHPDRRGAE